jgi:hypothetical protein
LRRAFGYALDAHLADPRFAGLIHQDAREYEEVLVLKKHIGRGLITALLRMLSVRGNRADRATSVKDIPAQNLAER